MVPSESSHSRTGRPHPEAHAGTGVVLIRPRSRLCRGRERLPAPIIWGRVPSMAGTVGEPAGSALTQATSCRHSRWPCLSACSTRSLVRASAIRPRSFVKAIIGSGSLETSEHIEQMFRAVSQNTQLAMGMTSVKGRPAPGWLYIRSQRLSRRSGNSQVDGLCHSSRRAASDRMATANLFALAQCIVWLLRDSRRCWMRRLISCTFSKSCSRGSGNARNGAFHISWLSRDHDGGR